MDEVAQPDRAESFRAMADRLDLTKEHPFGGAFVIVGPDGEEHSMLILDGSSDPAVFFGTVMTRCQMIVQKLEESRLRYGQR